MMEKTFSAGGVVVSKDGKVVVVDQDGLTWSLPKGKLEAGEDDLKAAIREINEETGLTRVELIKQLGSYDRHPMDKEGKDIQNITRHITFFLFKTEETRLQPIDPANPEARWVEPDNVSQLLTHPQDKLFFDSVLSEIKEFIASNSPA